MITVTSGTVPTQRDDDRPQGGQFGVGGSAADDADEFGRGGHRGMFPCFLGGSWVRLLRSSRSTRITWARVSWG